MTRLDSLLTLSVAVLATLAPYETSRLNAARSSPGISRVVPNDNRHPAGVLRGGVLTLRLDARLGDWHPDGDSAEGATVPAFAEESGPTRIPGPLIRVPAGTEIALTVHNSLTQALTLHGLYSRAPAASPRPGAADVVVLAPGEARAVRFKLDAPGTYYYFGSTRRQTIDWRAGDDAQLSGVIVVDPKGAQAEHDRIFVLGVWSDTAGRVLAQRTRILSVVNGRSWPNTERLHYAVGDTVRWRVINASADAHPMHLHGFYYMVDARGSELIDTTYETSQRRRVNTELLLPGATMNVSWLPERAGNWLFHCHLPDHFRASAALGMPRTPSSSPMSMHGREPMNHALSAMNGLVMGVIVRGGARRSVASFARNASARVRDLRLIIRNNTGGSASQPFYSFALERDGVKPPADSGLHTGPALVVARGEPVRITVVNTLDVPTSVHWHGIELESYFDGVAGFSGAGTHLAPIIAPHDSFVVRFTPPRSGTFIYHTHVDEARQQVAGLAGPLIVLEPGAVLDTTRDHVFLITTPPNFDDELRSVLVNASAAPAAVIVHAGVPQRLRFINMTMRRPGTRAEVWRDTARVTWRPLAKDGADLPESFQIARTARSNLSIGETMDYEIIPEAGGDWRIEFRALDGALLAKVPLKVVTEQ